MRKHFERTSSDDRGTSTWYRIRRRGLFVAWELKIVRNESKWFGAQGKLTEEQQNGLSLTEKSAFRQIMKAIEANIVPAKPAEPAADKQPPPPPPAPLAKLVKVDTSSDKQGGYLRNTDGATKAQTPEAVAERPPASPPPPATFVPRKRQPVDDIANILPDGLAKPPTIKKGEEPPASWLKVPAAAKAYGVSQATLYNRIKTGTPNSGKFGGTTFVEPPVEADS